MNRTIALHITKMLTGTISPAEVKELEAWLEQSDVNREEFHNIRMLWNNRDAVGENASLEIIEERIRKRIQAASRKRMIAAVVVMVGVLVSFFLVFYVTAAMAG
ncbi:MAG TPA: hypothetical protein VGK59_09375 [Ohtaekwangia sp.]